MGAELNRFARLEVLWSVGVSLLWVLLLWRFWQYGPEVLGLNAAVYLVATAGLFIWSLHRRGIAARNYLYWLIPWGLTALSYAIYDNQFLRMVGLPVLLVWAAVFYNYTAVSAGRSLSWTPRLVVQLVGRGVSAVLAVVRSMQMHWRVLSLQKATRRGSLVRRVVFGVLVTLLLLLFVVLPLLSSADPAFAASVASITDWFSGLLESSPVRRLLFAALLSVLTVAGLLAWNAPAEDWKDEPERPVDSVVFGIVLGGLLAVYLLFLGVQLQKLWVGQLPFEFKDAVYLVKSGFWQLLFLSVLNVAIYVGAYRRTVRGVQWLLSAFTLASLLLLASAGWRMGLYVLHYGFSYEKFFASYTVLYCTILFVWLVSRLFAVARADVLKFMATLFIWMFAVLALLPVEQIILRSNVVMAQLEGSRIRLVELTMLSPDAVNTVRELQTNGKLEKTLSDDLPDYRFYELEQSPEEKLEQYHEEQREMWRNWIDWQVGSVARKTWYERSLTDWLVRY
ncbi:MAG: DUF4153 domain-containing protein [bacterium]